jgi:hypothetical protein
MLKERLYDLAGSAYTESRANGSLEIPCSVVST